MAALLQLPTPSPHPVHPKASAPRQVQFELLDAGLARRRRGTTFAVSIAAHLALIAALVIVPLVFMADELVEPTRAVRAFFVAPPRVMPPPPPPPPPPAGVRPSLKVKPAAVPTPMANTFRAPVEVPAELPEEPGIDLGIEGGMEGGVEGGIAGGVLGGVVGGMVGIPTPAPAVVPVRVGGNIKAPKLLRRVDPVYPRLALDTRLHGIVILEAQVDDRGAVRQVRVLQGPPLLDAAAAEAVRQWRYQPLFLNGLASPFIVVVTVNFNLTAPAGSTSP